jgi:hypothetical protein
MNTLVDTKTTSTISKLSHLHCIPKFLFRMADTVLQMYFFNN